MGNVRRPLPVKLFIGMLSVEPSLFDACADIFGKKYGPLDFQSGILPWDRTDYYQDELGHGIVRKFIFFERLIDPAELPEVKLFTNGIETEFSTHAGDANRRRINLDPGYVTEAKVVLATTKDFAHRIYIGSNIYAEVTLRYGLKDRSFAAFDHTYPDYRTAAYLTVFNEARSLLRTALPKMMNRVVY
jgi:hypothetical protein